MAVALVNDAKAVDDTGVSSIVVTVPSTTAGNLLVLCVNIKDPAPAQVNSVSGGGTWVKARDTGGSEATSQRTEVWYVGSCTGAATSVTVTLSGNTRVGAWVGEFSGADGTLDVTAAQIGTGTSPATSSFTPTNADGVAVAVHVHFAATTTTTGFPANYTTPPNGNIATGTGGSSLPGDVVYRIDPTTSAQNPTWTISTSRAWGAAAAVFPAAASGQEINVGLVTETDATQIVGRSKSKIVKLARRS